MTVAHATREAYTVEELEHLDCALPAEPGRVAKRRGAHIAIGLLQDVGEGGEARDGAARVEEVAHDLEYLAPLGRTNKGCAHARLRFRAVARNVAHPGRIESALG